MSVYLLSNNSELESSCPFGVSYVSPDMLKNPRTHLKFVAADSTCIVDVMASLPLAYLPVSVRTVNVVPLLPENVFSDKVMAVLTHVFPQHAASLRKAYIFGEESFKDFIAGLNATYLWSDTIKTYLGGGV